MRQPDPATKLKELEAQLVKLNEEIEQVRAQQVPVEVENYIFQTLNGSVSLSELFGQREQLMLIHNMGSQCRFCTLWADGINGHLPYLESVLSVVLVSHESPAYQRKFAIDRGWRFNLASHGGGQYIKDQCVFGQADNYPGAVVYRKDGDKIMRLNRAPFGGGDQFNAFYGLMSLADFDSNAWEPQYHYDEK